MGIRGLSFYVNEYLEVFENHKLRNCNVIIDGKNLAHFLHQECSGINVAFGGDFDKYSNFVRKYFEGLLSCGVHSLVVMDGGQPPEGKKLKTAQERAEKQILRSLAVNVENQFKDKPFPPMFLQVFVTTLHSMEILVLQTDFEADDEIAALARTLDCFVISEDTDFFMTGVPYIRLSTIAYNCIAKNKYLACRIFNTDTFCESTGVNRSHLAVLGTLLANDYVDKEDLSMFFKRVRIEFGHAKRTDLSRPIIIQYVIQWVARRKKNTVSQIIAEAAGKNCKLKKKILSSVNGYTLEKSSLLDCIPSIARQEKTDGEDVEMSDNQHQNREYIFDTKKPGTQFTPASEIETTLVLKDGDKLPTWFVKAYRENKIPREVADILTRGYFFSPSQVECISFESTYLVVEPIVRFVYTFLWKSCRTKGEGDSVKKLEAMSLNGERADKDGCPKKKLKTEHNASMNQGEKLNSSSENDNSKINSKPVKEEALRWYIRKKKNLWFKNIKLQKGDVANQLPSLTDVEEMSLSERKRTYYKMLQMKCQSEGQDVPEHIEFIMNCIIYWFKNTKTQLSECHALTVLICFFQYYIIDKHIGRVRTKREYENVPSCQTKLSEAMQSPSYCKSDASTPELISGMSREECLIAGSILFKYHHFDKTMNRNKYNKKVVHAFSEYQACIYFFQLVNCLLCSPYSFLNIESLWGGTFGYNIFIELSGSKDRMANVKQILGQGTCLERLFQKIYTKLENVITFTKLPVSNRDHFYSKVFSSNSTKFGETEKAAKAPKDVKVKEKKKKESYDLGNNRFAQLMMDSNSDDEEDESDS